MNSRDGRRGFTIRELVAAVATIAAMLGIRAPAGTGTAQARRVQCQNNVRGVVQAMQAFAENNNGNYPLPSLLDRTGTTIGPQTEFPTNSQLEAKNNLGNALSVLVFNGSITPQMCVSPAEVSAAVQIDSGYQYASPQRAFVAGGNPATALWDPGFSGTASSNEPSYRRAAFISNNSYAGVVFFGARRQLWTNTHNATEPVFGNRGPKYAGTDSADRARWADSGVSGWRTTNSPTGTASNTLLIHGGRTTWEGNIGYNDGHVTYERRPDPVEVTFRRYGTWAENQYVADNLFVDETDDSSGGTTVDPTLRRNAWLRPVASVTVSGTFTTYSLWLD